MVMIQNRGSLVNTKQEMVIWHLVSSSHATMMVAERFTPSTQWTKTLEFGSSKAAWQRHLRSRLAILMKLETPALHVVNCEGKHLKTGSVSFWFLTNKNQQKKGGKGESGPTSFENTGTRRSKILSCSLERATLRDWRTCISYHIPSYPAICI